MIGRVVCLLAGHRWTDELVGIPKCGRCRAVLRPW